MKKSLITIFLIFSFYSSYSQNEGTAKVRKIDGFDVYLYSEPIAPYEVLDKVSAFWNWGADAYGRSSIEDLVATMVRRALKKNKSSRKSGALLADAIIIDNNDNGVMIRYKSSSNNSVQSGESYESEQPSLLAKLKKQNAMTVGAIVIFEAYKRVYRGKIVEVDRDNIKIEFTNEKNAYSYVFRKIKDVQLDQ
jgi:hypothetical protein